MLDRRRRSLEYALRSAEVTRWLEIQALRQGMETLRASEKLAAGRAAGADSARGDRELGPAALHLAQDARGRARAAAAEQSIHHRNLKFIDDRKRVLARLHQAVVAEIGRELERRELADMIDRFVARQIYLESEEG